MSDDIRVVCVPLPGRIKGFVRKNPDGSYTIVLNENYSYEIRIRTYDHELRHIMEEDAESDLDADCIELAAHAGL